MKVFYELEDYRARHFEQADYCEKVRVVNPKLFSKSVKGYPPFLTFLPYNFLKGAMHGKDNYISVGDICQEENMENRYRVGERIKEVRKKLGLTQKEFAEAIGISQSRLSEIEKGETTKESVLIAISQKFKVSLEWLKHGTGDMWLKSEEVIPAELIAVPVITSVGAGGFVYTPDHVLVERSKIKAKSLVAFRVEGDSMEPTIMRGEFVFIEEATEAEDNKVYLIACEEDNGLKVRRLRKIEGKWWLFCDNPAYPPEALKEECKIVGRVIGIYKPAEVKYL